MASRVARYHADRTNQKLYFSRIYCQLAEETPVGQLQDGHIESAVTHLYGGYLAFLQELARYYNLNLSAPTLSGIAQALETKTQVSPEVLRLEKLLKHDFLGEVEQAWQQILYKPAPAEVVDSDAAEPDSQRLPIIDVMASPANHAISVDMVRQWRSELLDLIDTLREGMIEF